MHRSGTSLVSRLLQGFDVWMGWRQDENAEALFFRELNEWMLRRSGGSWARPDSFQDAFAAADMRGIFTEHCTRLLSSPRRVSYLGPTTALRVSDIRRLSRPWGWKDPRNAFTLPIWQDICPELRVIHIMRHPIDVAASLKRREERVFARNLAHYRRRRWLYGLGGLPRRHIGLPQLRHLEGGVALWKQYVRQAKTNARQVAPERYLELRYEDLLREPQRHLEQLVAFCGVRIDGARLEATADLITPSRAFAYRQDESLVDYARTIAEEIEAFGY
jgi:hypothetical protein